WTRTSAVRISVIFSLGRRNGLSASCAASERHGNPNIPASGMAELLNRDLRVKGFRRASSGSVLHCKPGQPPNSRRRLPETSVTVPGLPCGDRGERPSGTRFREPGTDRTASEFPRSEERRVGKEC